MQLILPREVRAKLVAELRRAGRREIGGIIMAEQLSAGSFKVAHITVDQHSGSPVHFQRRPDAHQRELAEFFTSTGHDYARFNYLGEWHSHPSFSTSPSTTDLAAMESLLGEPEIDFAVMMIVRLRYHYWLSIHCEVFARATGRWPVDVISN